MSRLDPAWLVVGAAVLWGTTGTAQGLGPAQASPITVGAGRLAVGALALLVLAATGRVLPGRATFRRRSILAAGLAMAAYQPFFFEGVARTGVAVGTVIAIGSAPLLTGAATAVLERQTPSPRWWRATAVGLLGLGVLVLLSGTDTSLDIGGALLCLGAGASYAAYAVASRRYAALDPARRSAAAVFTVAALLLLPWLIAGDTGWLSEASGVAMVAWLGIGATAVAYWLYTNGLRTVAAPTAATLSLAEPVTAAVLGVALLSERPPALAWVGAALVMVALIDMIRASAQPS